MSVQREILGSALIHVLFNILIKGWVWKTQKTCISNEFMTEWEWLPGGWWNSDSKWSWDLLEQAMWLLIKSNPAHGCTRTLSTKFQSREIKPEKLWVRSKYEGHARPKGGWEVQTPWEEPVNGSEKQAVKCLAHSKCSSWVSICIQLSVEASQPPGLP